MTTTTVRLVTCLVLLAACSSKQEPPRVRGLTTAEGKPVVPKTNPTADEEDGEAEPEATETRRPRRLPSPFKPGPGDLTVIGGNTPAPAEEATPEDKAAAEQKAQQALIARLGAPATCLDLLAAAKQPGGRVTIEVSAYVMASGFVSTTSVTANGQSPAALSCLQRRVEGATLPGPIPDAPRRLTASTTFEVVAAAPPPAPGAPRPQPVQTGGYGQYPAAPDQQPVPAFPIPALPREPTQPGRPDDLAGPP